MPIFQSCESRFGQKYHQPRLLEDLFEDDPEWYNHYRMLNVRSHRPLSHHWEMYYIELGKFG